MWGNITSVSYLLDGNQPKNLTIENMNVPYLSNSSQNLNFSVPLDLTNGAHSIQVFISGYTYYCTNPLESVIHPLELANTPVEANTTVNFYAALPSLSPTVPEFPELTIPILLILCISAVLLVYFKKHNQVVPSQT